jgi:glycosidase
MARELSSAEYCIFNFQVSRQMWEKLRLADSLVGEPSGSRVPEIVMVRQLADRFNRLPERSGRPVPAGHLHLYGLMGKIFRYLVARYTEELQPRTLEDSLGAIGHGLRSPELTGLLTRFAELFPGTEIVAGRESAAGFIAGDNPAGERKKVLVREMLLLYLAGENPALDPFRELFDVAELTATSSYRNVAAAIDERLTSAPPFPSLDLPLPQLLRAPVKASPRSLPGQIEYIREHWREILPAELLDELLTALAIAREEERRFWGGPGRPQVLEFLKGRSGYEYPEFERYSPDSDWMANVVMIAKMVYVWLGQLAKKYGREIHRLDQVPDEELDCLARWGFTALWLIGLWERSPASAKIKQIGGNPEAISSAYSLFDYTIAADLGGEGALANLKERCARRGIRLASDMVPNHTGIFSKWTVEHPDWFIQLDYPPYPAYSFSGPDLSFAPEISLNIEDGYWERRDAAVVFKHYDHRSGRTRYIYHGNDGTSTPWNDTAQLNYLLPAVREAVIQTILHVARQFPIIRFDAAMTLAKKHYQRLWYPQPGHGSGVPSRAEHGMTREEFDHAFPEEFWREVVDRVAAEAPDTLLLAEAFWLMEGYFVRTLGMHRVYNSAFMNMLKMEENAKYRQTVKNVLEYDPRILRRFVNFMNNPDERTAVEQFGKEGKYFGACLLLVTMPGLPMFGHGQIEGFHEKYGMEYRRAYWDEPVDEHLVAGHEAGIFPLMRRRHLFSGSENFVFYDFFAGGEVDENVFAYSNGAAGERGLIFYHNRFAVTAGWVRTSTAIAAKDDAGGTVLVQKTLGEALGINPDGRFYYAFRDCIAGLEYLRSGRELCEEGLYVELGTYEYKAFLDFREIADDEFGSWGKLCHNLAGHGVASLAEELKQVRHGEVWESFGAVVGEAVRFLAGSAAKEDSARLRPLLEKFYADLNRHTICAGDELELAGEALREIEIVAGLAQAGGFAELVEHLPRVALFLGETTPGQLLLAAWLILHGAGRLAAVEDHPPVAAAWLTELGLDRAFGELARKAPEEAEAATLTTEEAVLLLQPLVRWQLFFAGWTREAAAARFTLLFANPGARRFLGYHTYGGVEWFSRERFEILLNCLLAVELLVIAAGEAPGRFADAAVPLRKAIHNYQAIAAEAGYQAERFLDLLRDNAVIGKIGED